MPDKMLVVIRHAKSQWPEGVPDIQRPLSGRGRRDAPEVGRWLEREDVAVTRAWVSPAVRTQQTWALVAAKLRPHPPHVIDDRIYAGHWSALLSVVRGFPHGTTSAAVVGHNPGCEELVWHLAGPGSDVDALGRLSIKYPTAGVAVLRFGGAWADLGVDGARLEEFVVPRG